MFLIMETESTVGIMKTMTTIKTMTTVVTVVIVQIIMEDKAEGVVNYMLDCAWDLSNIIERKQYGIDDIVDP